VEWDSVPLSALIVTAYVPGVVRSGVETESVDVTDPFAATLTLLGLRVAVGSSGERDAVVSAGATEAARFTVPVKLYRL
jgi:hypothetical protein